MTGKRRSTAIKFTFQKNCFFIFAALFLIELSIALFIHDSLLRPFVGDVLVIGLIFTFCKSFIDFRGKDGHWAVGIFLFACLIELTQFFHLAALLQVGGVMGIALGATFDWLDILAYAIGAGVIFIWININHNVPKAASKNK